MKRLLCVLLVAVLSLSFVFSQGAAEAAPKQREINVIAKKSGTIQALMNHISEFEEATGIKVNFELYAIEEVINKVNINNAAGGDAVDVFTFRPQQETNVWFKNGYFVTLNDRISELEDYEDIFESARDITTVEGQIVGVPYLVEGEMLWYNKDILARYGVEVPTTFDELLAAARKMYDPKNNVYGIAIRGAGNTAVTQFSGFLYGFGGDFVDMETMTATMNTPEALKALEFYADLCDCGPDGIKVSSTSEGVNWFNNCITAMRIDAYTSTYNHDNPKTSEVAQYLGYAMFPMGPVGTYTPYNCCSWAWGINSCSKDQDAAWEFVKWATSKEMDVIAMEEKGYSARSSTWADPRVEASMNPELMEIVLNTGKYGFTYDRPHNKNATEVRAIVGRMIDLAQSGLRGDALKAQVDILNAEMQAILDTEK